MPAQVYGYNTTSIVWDAESTEVTQSSVDFITISCEGRVKAEGQTLTGAMLLAPEVIEISANGPVGIDTALTGSTLDTRDSSFGADGTIVVTATYKIPLAWVIDGPGGEGGDKSESSSDRYDLRVELVDVPLLTHPVAMIFDRKSKWGLKALFDGIIEGNSAEDWDEDPATEFVYTETKEAYLFSSTEYSVDGITASPLDYARMLNAGIDTYQRPAVRWIWQAGRTDGPATDELNRVGDVTVPPRAPKVNNRQWVYAGCNDTEQAEEAHTTSREYVLSERGGVLKQIYKGGSGDISADTGP